MDYGCDRHAEVIESIDELDDRVRYLELSDNEIKTELKNLLIRVDKLCQTIERFMSGAWKLMVGAAAFGIGFVVWYIQNIQM